MRIIAYTYEANYHCPDCTRDRFIVRGAVSDESGVPFGAKDREGNTLHPVFSIDETPADLRPEDGGHTLVCYDCGLIISKNRHEGDGK